MGEKIGRGYNGFIQNGGNRYHHYGHLPNIKKVRSGRYCNAREYCGARDRARRSRGDGRGFISRNQAYIRTYVRGEYD